ncbi:MAG: Crp/Fnr family transcriptional regulator [Vallitaleaceae bacterium]|jgi:CRP-like cAMP-binding protein|nr:Crp/Fnr family transcriptional regulator [Vallitaleaceae bacterium]
MAGHTCSTCNNKLCVSKVPVFGMLNHEDLSEIIKLTNHPIFKKGEHLCHEGDELATLFIVNEGRVKLSKFNIEGKEQILNLVGEGDIFGEYHLLSDFEPYNFSAIALTDTKICTLSKENFDYLLDKHPSISRKILAELSRKLIRTENLAQNLSSVNTDAKVAYVLLEFAENYGTDDGEEVRIEIPVSREEMANYAGVTRETMSRKLSILIKEGIIDTVGNKVMIIKDLEALHGISGT